MPEAIAAMAVRPRGQHRGALVGALAATATVSAVGGVLAAARLARWAGRLAPDESTATTAGEEHPPAVVVPLIKPSHNPQDRAERPERHGVQHQPKSGYDVGDTIHQLKGAVKA